MAAWLASVRPDINAIESDDDGIATAANREDPTSLAGACSKLKTDVVAFETAPPVPDAPARADLARWLDAFSTAATQCADGDLTAMNASLTNGNRYLAQARDRINALLPASPFTAPDPLPPASTTAPVRHTSPTSTPTTARATTAIAPTTSVAPPPTTRPPAPITVINCGGEPPAVRPTTLYFACGDGGISVTGLTWATWGGSVATASGMLHEQDCIPNCASGGYASEPAQVTLSAPRPIDGTTAYTSATVTPSPPNTYNFRPITQSWPQ